MASSAVSGIRPPRLGRAATPSSHPPLTCACPHLPRDPERRPTGYRRSTGTPPARRSGRWSWRTPRKLLLTAACDHTDRDLEVHGVAWSKNAGPDVLARRAWRLADVESRLDDLPLRAWDTHGDTSTEIQHGTLAELLAPAYWIDVPRSRGGLTPGTVLISGTIPMPPGVDRFADGWTVELAAPATGDTIRLQYDVQPMPAPIG
ncbi:DUF2848 domain-containing protein [Streptomyces sp. NBC_01723]|uniref:DUF2848 family protein n=1 Tax=Streptomyces sp. NBC_01723 TaxID=2975921 RepID=UPI002E313782|nr:DUF2848 family protein [Streptomyces sp. NBC_01723]